LTTIDQRGRISIESTRARLIPGSTLLKIQASPDRKAADTKQPDLESVRRNLRIRLEVLAEFRGCSTVDRYLDSERESRESR
jgi:hypothetical protein